MNEQGSSNIPRQRGEEYVVGIDLGTTNSAIAYAPLDRREEADFAISQRVSPTQVAERPLLPSFLYLPGPHELPPGATTLPWDQDRDFIVGQFAREQSSRIPGRVVSSAKSWLAHRRAEPDEAFLPREALSDSKHISPLEASYQYLRHMRESWDQEHPQQPLALQHIVLTVPASFDEIARELTLRAAERAGLENITLLEEPQAAFYAWLWQLPQAAGKAKAWQQELQGVEQILICDIGGGTTDFTVIKVGDESLERVAVGDHLLLGGDNFDLAIASLVEPRLSNVNGLSDGSQQSGKLNLLQWGVLCHECRRVKEILLGENPPEACTVTVPGTGSKLLAAAKTAKVSAEEVAQLVLEGFFPLVDFQAPLQEGRAALRELGLPYASDPAVPRHLAAFLRRNDLKPDAILFNGGACRPLQIRSRMCQILHNWSGKDIRVLSNAAPDLAVSRGAAAFGWLKAHGQERIKGGISRSFYLGVSPSESVCVIHRNQDEDEKSVLSQPQLHLTVGRPINIPLFAATDRPADKPGDIVKTEELKELGALQTVVEAQTGKTQVDVTLSAQVTEIGTMALWVEACDRSKRWALEMPLRGGKAYTRRKAQVEINPQKLSHACDTIRQVFNSKPNKTSADSLRPRTLLATLEEELGPRDKWPTNLARGLWEAFWECNGRRRCDPEFEAAWLNGAGFCLRPGVGYPLDSWRTEQMATLIPQWMQFSSDDRIHKEWWIMWRRLSAGLSVGAQTALWAQMAPRLIPGRRHIKSRLKNLSEDESKEFTRLAVCLERIPMSEKLALGQLLSERFKPKAEPAWLLARVGARRLAGAGSQHVVPPEQAAPWAELFLNSKWNDERVGQALADIARCTGERGLDLDEELRQRAAKRLRQANLDKLARCVLEVVELEDSDLARFLGEDLPLGLRL